jgi:tryptophan-rich sensory protein
MKKNKLLDYGIPVLSVSLVGLLGSIFVKKGMSWFEKLDKPTQWIPSAIIPIMWTIIYTITILYIIHLLRKEKWNNRIVSLLVINGILNVLWCFTFFTMHQLFGGLIVIILNLHASVLLLKEISKTSEVYSYLMLVYPGWLSLATCLNMASWILN